MAIAAKDRFIKTGINRRIMEKGEFPDTQFDYGNYKLTILGLSNKDDLIPLEANDLKMQKMLIEGNMKQYVCTSKLGDLFDVAIYEGEDDDFCYLYGIRTRTMPDKKNLNKGEK